MAKDRLSCMVCFEYYLRVGNLPDGSFSPDQVDRRPAMLCGNGHTVCMTCARTLHDQDELSCCPACRGQLLAEPILNRSLLDAMELLSNQYASEPEIIAADLKIEAMPFACGACADIFKATWHSQLVVVKAIRLGHDLTKYRNQMVLEANLAIGLHHPNIVRLFGTTTLANTRLAIVMEHADRGSLEAHMGSMKLGSQNQELGVQILLGVIDGLDYVHSCNIAHRDLKPQNILLCGPEMRPKIADFGISKIMQTVLIATKEVGTPKYTAPELLESSAYGCTADIYSLTIIVYELFSGRQAESDLGSTPMQIGMAVLRGQRPTVPTDFPDCLRDLITRGWAAEPDSRPALSEFRTVVRSMSAAGEEYNLPLPEPPKENVNVTVIQQTAEVSKVSFPLPVMQLQWASSCEMGNSVELRKKMVSDIRSKSNMSKFVNESVLCVMKVTPRHLFIYWQNLQSVVAYIGSWLGMTPPDSVTHAYQYNQAMRATPSSNESSPEIIGTQLSLTEILPGQAVLLVGSKGGYIQSLVAQLVGIYGCVVTVGSDAVALGVCRERVDEYCPLKSIVRWIQVDDVKNPKKMAAAMQKENLLFHTIIYCGSTNSFPELLRCIFQPTGDVSIMVPVKNSFQLSQRRDGSFQMKTITDFGVIFEGVH